ncbi:MAG: GYD domain-containing protein [Betaproteobacteria bacterium]
MSKYLFEACYTAEGVKGLLRDGGSGRRTAIEAMLKGVGGKLECLYFALGDVDVYLIADLPDNLSAAAVALAVNQGGGATTKTVALMSVEDVDQAAKKTVAYRAPGR